MKKIFLLILTISLALIFSCSTKEKEKVIVKSNAFETLVSYIEENANILNNEDFPYFLLASEVYQGIKKNFLIIDLRSEEAFEFEHIQNAINISPNNLIDYFDNSINATSFDTIVFVCYTGQTSSFCTAGMRLLGYDNVYSLKHGLAAWDSTYAADYKFNDISSFLIDKLETNDVEMHKTVDYPIIETENTEAYLILRERIQNEFNSKITDNFLKIQEIIANPEQYYIASYLPKDIYLKGHIVGAVNYEPKNPFTKSKFLNSLPTDKTIIIDCYNGIQSSLVIMYLRVLGYDAKNIYLGQNSFMYDKVVEQGFPNRYFAEKDIENFPLEKTEAPTNTSEEASKKVIPKGGC